MTDQRFTELANQLRPKRPPVPQPDEQRAWADLSEDYGGTPIEDDTGAVS